MIISLSIFFFLEQFIKHPANLAILSEKQKIKIKSLQKEDATFKSKNKGSENNGYQHYNQDYTGYNAKRRWR